eukprot:101565-Chlamydomonas_euryale.AAC.1
MRHLGHFPLRLSMQSQDCKYANLREALEEWAERHQPPSPLQVALCIVRPCYVNASRRLSADTAVWKFARASPRTAEFKEKGRRGTGCAGEELAGHSCRLKGTGARSGLIRFIIMWPRDGRRHGRQCLTRTLRALYWAAMPYHAILQVATVNV